MPDYKIVDFPSLGVTLRGRLYMPQAASAPAPIVVMAHGFSATIDGMVADRYAEVFHEAGFAVLLYDHYSLGISEGEPRHQLNRWTQARGYIDAITWLMTLPDIDSDRIAIWGDSMSGGEVIVVGAVDTRVKAVVAQVPACGSQAALDDPDGRLFDHIRDTLLNIDLTSLPTTSTGLMPVVSFDQLGTPSLLKPLTAYRWFMEFGARYGTNWENKAARVTPETAAPFHPALAAPQLSAALLMMVAYDDEMPGANSEVARMTYAAAAGPKQLVEIEGGHFGLVYYPSDLFTEASQTQRDFLIDHL